MLIKDNRNLKLMETQGKLYVKATESVFQYIHKYKTNNFRYLDKWAS